MPHKSRKAAATGSSNSGTNKGKAPTDDRDARLRRESGEPGGGSGRRDELGETGVHPLSGGVPEGTHPEIRTQAEWGQGDRGAAGYPDAGGSELTWREGRLLGGLTSGPSGEPTIDIHGGDHPPGEVAKSGKPPARKRKKRR